VGPQQAPAPDRPARYEVAVVGGGIVGLALARELLLRRPGASVCVLERENEIAAHQTSHNSGVVHAGIYYKPGSLKARLCVQGAREMYEYCEQHGITSERCGKLILAVEPSELPRLQELERRGRANGVSGLRLLDRRGIEEVEPHARGVAGLHSAGTGIVDFAEVARALAQDIRAAGGAVLTGCGVDGVRARTRSLELTYGDRSTIAGHAVFCAGAWADRMAALAGADPDPRIVPFRGSYLKLRPDRRSLVRSLIYPVPDPSLPFLGVHLTRHIGGEVLVGPTAMMAAARGAGAGAASRARELVGTLAWPGTRRMLARNWRAGAIELRHAARRAWFVDAAARYVPELRPSDVQSAFAGVRAQAVGRDGALVDDFALSGTERALHVRNAPSPAATASLAIARMLADEVAQAFELTP
jgi:L-2-hydroxyglutarate oxidase